MDLDELEREVDAGHLTCMSAADLLHGCVRVEDAGTKWVRPCRFTEAQERAIGSCRAWHPGLYRQMAKTTAGVTCAFRTDASEVVFELRVDAEPTGSRRVLRDVDAWRASRGMAPENDSDGLALEVDGRMRTIALSPHATDLYRVALDDPKGRPLTDVLQLPVLGGMHEVRIWLPALRGCAMRRVWGNGTLMQPVADRPCLLVLGDSIAQGFVTGGPAHAWPTLLANRLGMDLLNQGLGGQVFQPDSIMDLPRAVQPQSVIVAFGANYRYERCSEGQVAAEVRSYLRELAHAWPDANSWVITPTWHNEELSTSHARSCWRTLPKLISDAAAQTGMRVVDGLKLLDDDVSLFADGYEHPNAAGSVQMSDRLNVTFLSLAGTTTHSELRARALEVLGGGPASTFVLAEAIRRACVDVLFADHGCVLARAHAGEQILWATDGRLADAVIATLVSPDGVVDLHSPGLSEELGHRYGLTRVAPYHVAIYEQKRSLSVGGDRDIRVLNESFVPCIVERYGHPEWVDERTIRALVADGRFLGGFEGEELVGFIGEHSVGAMGMLDVLPAKRRHGWGCALEAAQINRTLERGDTPWTQVFSHNRASLRLQRKLGLTIVAATDQCFLSAPDADGQAGRSIGPVIVGALNEGRMTSSHAHA